MLASILCVSNRGQGYDWGGPHFLFRVQTSPTREWLCISLKNGVISYFNGTKKRKQTWWQCTSNRETEKRQYVRVECLRDTRYHFVWLGKNLVRKTCNTSIETVERHKSKASRIHQKIDEKAGSDHVFLRIFFLSASNPIFSWVCWFFDLIITLKPSKRHNPGPTEPTKKSAKT